MAIIVFTRHIFPKAQGTLSDNFQENTLVFSSVHIHIISIVLRLDIKFAPETSVKSFDSLKKRSIKFLTILFEVDFETFFRVDVKLAQDCVA